MTDTGFPVTTTGRPQRSWCGVDLRQIVAALSTDAENEDRLVVELRTEEARIMRLLAMPRSHLRARLSVVRQAIRRIEASVTDISLSAVDAPSAREDALNAGKSGNDIFQVVKGGNNECASASGLSSPAAACSAFRGPQHPIRA
ncbi:MAG TPA: hypothetical protein VHA37_07760 [Candidatus Saccharimonadales bacterium]|nr:hypothetical protein [Candidatus Saccharimonadales bacterium]